MRGISITYFELTELDIQAEEKDQIEENTAVLKRLDSVLNKIKDNKKVIDKDTVKLEMTEDGEIIYKSNIGICARCGNLLEHDSKYCKICGGKILK